MHKRIGFLSFLFVIACAVAAQTPAEKTPPLELTLESVQPKQIRLGREVRLTVRGLSEKVAKEKFDVQTLALSIDGRVLPKLTPRVLGRDLIAYDLKRNDDTREAWAALLGRPTAPLRTKVEVRLLAGALPIAVTKAEDAEVTLLVYQRAAFWWCLVGLTALIVLFVWLARTSNILRDSAPPKPPAGKKKPYSLARFQMAVWFFLVVAAFLFLYIITLTYDTLTPQALVLIGIGTGTALGASVIDANKRSGADTTLNTLQPQQARIAAELQGLQQIATSLAAAAASPAATPADIAAATAAQANRDEKQEQLNVINGQIADANARLSQPVSTSFLMDILTDENGISFHRFQMFVWTLILGAIFCVKVWEVLTMPEFNETLLALLGISAGTYLGFKVPERQ